MKKYRCPYCGDECLTYFLRKHRYQNRIRRNDTVSAGILSIIAYSGNSEQNHRMWTRCQALQIQHGGCLPHRYRYGFQRRGCPYRSSEGLQHGTPERRSVLTYRTGRNHYNHHHTDLVKEAYEIRRVCNMESEIPLHTCRPLRATFARYSS